MTSRRIQALIKIRLAKLRRTPYWLAKTAGVATTHIYTMLNGRVSERNLRRLLKALDMPQPDTIESPVRQYNPRPRAVGRSCCLRRGR